MQFNRVSIFSAAYFLWISVVLLMIIGAPKNLKVDSDVMEGITSSWRCRFG